MKAYCAICHEECNECKDSLDMCATCKSRLAHSYTYDPVTLHTAQNTSEALQALKNREREKP